MIILPVYRSNHPHLREESSPFIGKTSSFTGGILPVYRRAPDKTSPFTGYCFKVLIYKILNGEYSICKQDIIPIYRRNPPRLQEGHKPLFYWCFIEPSPITGKINHLYLETIASLPGFGMAPVGHLSYSADPNIRARRTTPCSVRVRIDPIPPKG